jgi:xylan 1,4-beta-xylosidase
MTSQGGGAGLLLTPGTDTLWGRGGPAFLARRVQHARFTAETTIRLPLEGGVSAGLAVFQNEEHHYFLAVRAKAGGVEVFVERLNGGPAETVARAEAAGAPRVGLRICADGASCRFEYSESPGSWRELLTGADATLLSTRVAGGFVGAVVGPHARVGP